MSDNHSLSELYDILNKKSMQIKKDIGRDKIFYSKTPTFDNSLKSQNELQPGTIDERIREVDLKRRELVNDDKRQDIDLKKKTSIILFVLLSAEIIAAFVLVFFKGFKLIEIDDSMLDILLTSTLLQTAYMTTIIISYLFPKKK